MFRIYEWLTPGNICKYLRLVFTRGINIKLSILACSMGLILWAVQALFRGGPVIFCNLPSKKYGQGLTFSPTTLDNVHTLADFS